MPPKQKSGPKKRVFEELDYRGICCCVVGCSKRQGTKDLSFFKVIRKNPEQSEKWIQAMQNDTDGTDWRPSKATR